MKKLVVKIRLLPLKKEDYIVTSYQKGIIVRAVNTAIHKYLYGDDFGAWFV